MCEVNRAIVAIRWMRSFAQQIERDLPIESARYACVRITARNGSHEMFGAEDA
jgi:hypothetical protein